MTLGRWVARAALGTCLALATHGVVPVPDAHAEAAGPRKTPKKARPRPKPRKVVRRKPTPPAMQRENDLHNERLAVLGRLREINDELRDAELAATIRNIDELEGQRWALVLRLQEAATAPDARGSEP